jgi:hypothetical protein
MSAVCFYRHVKLITESSGGLAKKRSSAAGACVGPTCHEVVTSSACKNLHGPVVRVAYMTVH